MFIFVLITLFLSMVETVKNFKRSFGQLNMSIVTLG